MRAALLAVLLTFGVAGLGVAHDQDPAAQQTGRAAQQSGRGGQQTGRRLPVIGPATDFSLTDQDRTSRSLRNFRGRAVVISFIYTSCRDTCPLLTAKLVDARDRLSPRAAKGVSFLSITVDPEHDTPEILRDYAAAQGATGPGWHFLTGPRPAITDIARGYGVLIRPMADGDIDHTLLTSIIDGAGRVRVQYLGTRFDPAEFARDLSSLLPTP